MNHEWVDDVKWRTIKWRNDVDVMTEMMQGDFAIGQGRNDIHCV